MRLFIIVICLLIGTSLYSTANSPRSYTMRTKNKIRTCIDRSFTYLKTKNTKWSAPSNSKVEQYVNILYIGSQVLNIPYEDVISIISIESEWKEYAKGVNKDKYGKVTSVDYGLCQINTQHLLDNYIFSKRILDKYHIKTDIKNMYDPALNIMSAFVYLDEVRSRMFKEDGYSYKRYITSYNVGYRGSTLYSYKAAADKYYSKFSTIREVL